MMNTTDNPSSTAKNPGLQKAVALFYDGVNAPHISAKGAGKLAEEIIAIAQEHGVPLCDNPTLVDLLVNLELGDEIPEALYVAVAYIIAFAYQLDGKTPQPKSAD
jgi:flagellar biosynthesis protein